MSSYQKRKKSNFYNSQKAKKKREFVLKPGLKGFLCTCNSREKDCIRESYNILNEYADSLYGEEQGTAGTSATLTTCVPASTAAIPNTPDCGSEDDDIETALNKELDTLKAERKKLPSMRRFQVVESGANNCIFIQTTLSEPVELVHHIMKDLEATKKQKSRFLLRLLPIEATCKLWDELLTLCTMLERCAGGWLPIDVLQFMDSFSNENVKSKMKNMFMECMLKCNKKLSSHMAENATNCFFQEAGKLFNPVIAGQLVQLMQKNKDVDCLQMLLAVKLKYPEFAHAALQCIWAPTNSVDTERYFSKYNLIVSDRRTRMTEQNVEAYLEDIRQTADSIFDKYFSKEGRTFAVLFNRRNSSGVNREELIHNLAEMVLMRNPENRADLKHPQLAIIVEIIRNMCCISVLPEYFQLRKYNLLELCAPEGGIKVMDRMSVSAEVIEGENIDDKETEVAEAKELVHTKKFEQGVCVEKECDGKGDNCNTVLSDLKEEVKDIKEKGDADRQEESSEVVNVITSTDKMGNKSYVSGNSVDSTEAKV